MKKNKIILHIGMQRTGTTFLQWEIFPRLNIRYISPEFFKYGEIGTLAEFYHFLRKEDTLVSNENIHYHIRDKEDTRFQRLEIIHKLFPDAKIIFGVREKNELLKSLYRKTIANGAIWSYEEFLKEINIKVFNDYETYIDRLRELFSEVHVYKYEEFKTDPQKFVEKICEFIGVETPTIDKNAWTRKWNIGYTDRQIKIARAINRIFKTRLNKKGIIPLDYKWHPHRIIFQKEIIFRLQNRKKLLPVYPAKKRR